MALESEREINSIEDYKNTGLNSWYNTKTEDKR